MVEHTPVARIVGAADVDVEPAVIVEVEDGVGHVPLVPADVAEVVGLEPCGLVARPVEMHVHCSVVDEELAPISARACPPVPNLTGQKVDVAVVVHVGAEGRRAVAAEPEGLSVGVVVPIARALYPRDRRPRRSPSASGTSWQ